MVYCPCDVLKVRSFLQCDCPLTYVPSGELTFLDGRVAAVVGTHVITTPNQNVIWDPHFGTRNVHLRADFRYGVDDPLNWPQPYASDYPYLGAIRRKPREPNDSLAILWWQPLVSDFIPSSTSLVSGLGQLHRSKLDALSNMCRDLRIRLQPFSNRLHPEGNVNGYGWINCITV